MLEEEAVCSKATVCWSPGKLSIEIVDSRFDDWAGLKRGVSGSLKESNGDSAIHSRRLPHNVEWFVSRDDLILSWWGYVVENLSNNRWSKGQKGGRDEWIAHDVKL